MRRIASFILAALMISASAWGASGTIMDVSSIVVPGTSAAGHAFRAGGSTPAEQIRAYTFDAASDEFVDIYFSVANYASGGLQVDLGWVAASATSGNVVWQCAVRRADTSEDLDTSHTYAYNTVTTGAPGTNGFPAYSAITFTDGADQDSIADGESGIMRCGRDADNASDTMTGDAQLVWVYISEQ